MKTTKKFLSILLATILILSLFPVTLAHASDNTVTFSAETDVVSAKAGDIVNVDICMSENSIVAALTLIVNYDNTALKILNVQSKEAFGYEEFNTAYGNNKLAYLTASANPKTVGGTLFTIQFEVIKDGCTEISLSVKELADIDLQPIPSATQSAEFHDYDNGVLTRPTETSKGYYTYTCKNDGNHTTTEIVESADYTEYDNALQKLEGYLLNSNLTTESKQFIFSEVVKIIQNNSVFLNFVLNEHRDLIASEQYIVDDLTNEINEIFQVVDSIIANCEAGNHIVRAYTPDNNATCIVNGTKRGACYVCGTRVVVDDENNPALGHDIVVDNAVSPDCVNTGLEEGSHCSRCDDATVEQVIVPALGHKYESEITKPATHTENGEMTYTCHCGDSYTETINATGDHYYAPEITPPACTEAGFTTYTCVCGDTYVGDETQAKGHSFSNGSCTVCGEADPDYYVFSVKEPSRTTIRNKDGIILHTEIEGNTPAGSYVEWTSSNSNFGKTEMNDGQSLRVIANNKGYTTFTATLYDVNGNVLATDTVELYSQSGFFDKIVGFFRSLFGMTMVYEK